MRTREVSLAAVSQNQALNALMFLYKEVLKVELAGIDAKRAKHNKRLPVVLTSGEVAELLKGVTGDAGLVCKLLYGCGLALTAGTGPAKAVCQAAGQTAKKGAGEFFRPGGT